MAEANPGGKFVYIVDTRPKINAMANRAGGKVGQDVQNLRKHVGAFRVMSQRLFIQTLSLCSRALKTFTL